MNNMSIMLRNLRMSHNLRQSEVANALGLSLSAYSHYECGSRMPDMKILMKICVFYQINMNYMVFVICMDIAAKGQIEQDNVFKLFTYGNPPAKDEYQLLSYYRAMSLAEKTNVQYFIESIFNKII